jgi:hypothetical protein
MENSMKIHKETNINNKKTKNNSTKWPCYTILGHRFKGMWINIQERHLHTHIDYSTIHNSQLWNQPSCPRTNEWIKKMWYMYTIEYYWSTMKNEIMLFARQWIELNIIVLSMFLLKCGIYSYHGDYDGNNGTLV